MTVDISRLEIPAKKLSVLKRNAEQGLRWAQKNCNARTIKVWEHAAEKMIAHDNAQYLHALRNVIDIPVTIDEFIDSTEFLGHDPDFKVWETLREDLRCMNPDIWAGQEHIFQTFDGGATGCHAAGTLILMYQGDLKKVEDIKVGDALMGPDSKPRHVLALARGKERMYRITPNFGGEPFVVNEGHILSLERVGKTNSKTDNKKGQIVNITVKEWLGWSKTKKHLHKLRRKPVEFPGKSALPIPAYIMGVWLGDGLSGSPAITNIDAEVIKEWKAYCEKEGYRLKEADNTVSAACNYFMRHKQGVKHPWLEKLRSMGVYQNKHIPYLYLTASRQDRLNLLAGLLDTDGSVTCGGYEITQKRKRLAEDIVFLARSLGFRVSFNKKVVNGYDYWRAHITGDVSGIPVRIRRKKIRNKLNRNPLLSGFKVQALRPGNYYGFTLSGDHLYLTGDFTVHHNTGKSFKAMITQAYQLYTLSCFKRPIKLWPRLSANTPLLFVFQSVQERVTKRVLYEPFREMFTQMPYAKRKLIWDKDKDNMLVFSNGIQVVPILAAVTNIVGAAIVSGILDEVNFMSVVEESKQVVGARGQGGKYDQAQIIYTSITRRRKSRFITNGPSPGCISVLSSVRYLGDFMDRRLKEIDEFQEKNIHVMRRAQYEAQPASDYSGKKFRLLVGRSEYSTRVLKKDEREGRDYAQGATVKLVPIEYLDDFRRDPEGALRDVCGIATDVISPFITQRHKIIEAIVRGRERGMKPWVTNADIELGAEELGSGSMPQIIPENLPRDRDKPRFVHIDLSLTGDRCGIAIVKVLGHTAYRGENDTVESLPHYALEQGITIKPSATNELDLEAVRKWIVMLKQHYGLNIHTVSYDGFQSAESMQMLRKAGILSWVVSADKTTEPYEYLKTCLYQDRIDMQDHEILRLELAGLERNEKKKKVDHPPRGSKDLADALACAVYSASQNRTVRASTTANPPTAHTRGGRARVTERPKSTHRRVRR